MSVKIGLDAGHGLYTSGKQTPDKIKEWTLNDKVCDKIATFLKDYDCEIIRTDNNEGNVDEGDVARCNAYLNAGVKAAVSIHHNAFTGNWNNATGVEVWTDRNPTADDTRLANCIYNRLVKHTGLRGRGIKKENWTVINQNKIPAVLCEGGFMDGSNDYKIITSDAGQIAYAKAVAEGLVEFLGLTKKKVVVAACNGKINGYNISRQADYLVIYDKGSNSNTNQYGTEVAVNSNGVVTCTPVYGKGKMAIPSGGYVISGHGVASTWILENIKKGNQITISNNTIKIGKVAAFNGKISGYNIIRQADCLVVYNNGKNANTNQWGTEVSVNSIGVATCAPVYGKGKMAIPAGGYVISGHGIAGDWIAKNIKKGSKITISNGIVKVGVTTSSKTTQKSLDDWAKEVIKGVHGNGTANRRTSLEKAGCPYTYEQVQARVNQLV